MKRLIIFAILGILLIGVVSLIYLQNDDEFEDNLEYNYQEKIPLYYNLEDEKVYTRNGDLFEEVEING